MRLVGVFVAGVGQLGRQLTDLVLRTVWLNRNRARLLQTIERVNIGQFDSSVGIMSSISPDSSVRLHSEPPDFCVGAPPSVPGALPQSASDAPGLATAGGLRPKATKTGARERHRSFPKHRRSFWFVRPAARPQRGGHGAG